MREPLTDWNKEWAACAEEAAQNDERAAFEAKFSVPGGVDWDGTKYVVRDGYENSYPVERFGGQWEAWQARAAASTPTVAADAAAPFQQRVQPWMFECFGAEIAADRMERNHRFFEEATELVQACGMTASEAHQLVDYTFGRPVGEPNQEVGGVMVTLAALCLANGLDMHAAGEMELARISVPQTVAKIRAKQAAKPKHSPLPEAADHFSHPAKMVEAPQDQFAHARNMVAQPDERTAFEAIAHWTDMTPFAWFQQGYKAATAVSQATVKGDEAAGTLIAIARLLSEAGYAPELRIIDAVREVIARAAAPQAEVPLPPDVRALLTECAGFHGKMVKGNWLSAEAAKLLAGHAAGQRMSNAARPKVDIPHEMNRFEAAMRDAFDYTPERNPFSEVVPHAEESYKFGRDCDRFMGWCMAVQARTGVIDGKA